MGIFSHKAVRIGAFLATLGGATALVGAAATSTGAYFTDVHSGSINGTFGTIALQVNGVAVPAGDSTSGLSITWNDMLPGQDKTVTFTVEDVSKNPESIWLAFDNSNGEWANINQLGAYGNAKINSPLLNATYANLNNYWAQGTAASGTICGDPRPPIGYLPAENHVLNLSPGQSGSFTFSFGFSSCLSNSAYQGQPALAAPLLYDIMATQLNVRPDDAHNGGTYTPPAPPANFTFPEAGESWHI